MEQVSCEEGRAWSKCIVDKDEHGVSVLWWRQKKSMEQVFCNGGGRRAWSRCLVVENEEEHGAGVL